MALTNEENIRDRLRASYNTKRMVQYYRLQKFAFGEGWEEYELPSQDTTYINDFPDVVPDYLAIGRSRRILNHTFITMSKILYANPIPEFQGITSEVAQIRREFWRKRSTENKYGEDFSNEIASAFLDGDSLGLGFVQLGLVNGIAEQRISLKHVPITQVIWDRTYKNPGKGRFVAFIHYLPEDLAIEQFGQDVWSRNQRTQYNVDSQEYPVNNLRIIEYYDIGWGSNGKPTRCVFASDFGGEVLIKEENPFGKMLPFAFYQNWTPPGCLQPIGRIVQQLSTQEALNELEENLRETILRGTPFTLLDKGSIDPMDFENLNSGEPLPVVGYTPGQGSPFVRVPGAEVPQTLLAYQSYLERLLSTESGLSDLDRSNTLGTVRSAQEVGLLQQSSQIQGAWSRKQLAIFYKQIIEKLLRIAKDYDRDPLMIEFQGQDFLMNDPEVPQSWIEFYLTDEAVIFVDETSLDQKDGEAEKLKKLAILQQLQPDLAAGLINAEAYIGEKLKILGLDPATFIKPVEPPMPPVGPEQGLPPELAQGMPQLDVQSIMSAMGEGEPAEGNPIADLAQG